jgi:hypothetical protein
MHNNHVVKSGIQPYPEGVTCRAVGAANDWGWGDDNLLPKFNECLFMRKIADNLAPMIAEHSAKIFAS